MRILIFENFPGLIVWIRRIYKFKMKARMIDGLMHMCRPLKTNCTQ